MMVVLMLMLMVMMVMVLMLMLKYQPVSQMKDETFLMKIMITI